MVRFMPQAGFPPKVLALASLVLAVPFVPRHRAPRRKALVSLLFAALAVAAGAPTAADAHGASASTIQGHFEEDSVAPLSPHRPTAARPVHPRCLSDGRRRGRPRAGTGDEGEVGQMGAGCRLARGRRARERPCSRMGRYSPTTRVGDNATETYPVQTTHEPRSGTRVTGTQTSVNVTTGFNIFCSGLAHLMDGSLFAAGAARRTLCSTGIRQTHVFDPTTNTWSLGPDMAAARWYPSVTPLSNGEMLITEGGPQHARGAHRPMGPSARSTTASLNLAALSLDGRRARRPRLLLRSHNQTMRSLDSAVTAPGRPWRSATPRTATTAAMPFLTSARSSSPAAESSLNSARVINLNGPTPQVSTRPGDGDGATPAVQPHGARRRHRARHRRQLVRSLASWT